LSINELDRDPDPAFFLAHTAFKHIAHTKLSAHLLHADSLALEDERRVRAMTKRSGILERPVMISSVDAVAEILLLGIAAHVVKGENGNGGLIGKGSAGASANEPCQAGSGMKWKCPDCEHYAQTQ
jgi:hypothetical protein